MNQNIKEIANESDITISCYRISILKMSFVPAVIIWVYICYFKTIRM